jgi:amino acid transporter
LTVAVSTAAGVENLASAMPILMTHKESVSALIIFLMTVFNLRGAKESASFFAFPTYLFIFSIFILIIVGFFKILMGQVEPAVGMFQATYPELPLFLILKSFSSGCYALTGVEAISNGIPLFQNPKQKNAKITLLWMSFILGILFLSITLLAHFYKIVPNSGETMLSALAGAVVGRGYFYYLIEVSTALILVLAANTSYADFPRLSSLLAKDRFLPRQLASVGDRLVFSNGILGLSFSAFILILLFQGETHHLIPLYAIGVFMSFTLSQSGMVVHHIRKKEDGWALSLLFNFLGALTTFIVLLVIGSTKFLTGAWMVVGFIPFLIFLYK